MAAAEKPKRSVQLIIFSSTCDFYLTSILSPAACQGTYSPGNLDGQPRYLALQSSSSVPLVEYYQVRAGCQKPRKSRVEIENLFIVVKVVADREQEQ